jgi:RNA polymerase sigma-70 factor (ECF subfamily)
MIEMIMATPTRSSSPSVSALATLSDSDLAYRAAKGEAAAFRLIMERNNGRLYRVARAVLRIDAEAEDVVQEAYVRAFAKLASFRAEASLSTWLTRIALNEALQRLRRRRITADLDAVDREPVSQGAEVIWFPGAPSEPDPEGAASRQEVAKLLERAIDALPDAFRMVFLMRAVEEMSVEETSVALSIPEATVKTRLHRARGLLRTAIQAEIGSVLSDAFPFAGRRCQRTTEQVLARLGLTETTPTQD